MEIFISNAEEIISILYWHLLELWYTKENYRNYVII